MLLHGMNVVGLALAWVAILVGGWLGWQLLRQNGRLLLRLDELEKRLDELEFGDGEEPAGLPIGSDAPSFELPDLEGEPKSLAQYRGRPLLLILFNPACRFCREFAPRLAASSLRPTSEQTSPHANGEKSNHDPLVIIITSGDLDQNRTLFNEHHFACPILVQKDLK